jgi:serine/threonine protein kinase
VGWLRRPGPPLPCVLPCPLLSLLLSQALKLMLTLSQIGDYGASTVYRLPWEATIHMSTGLCGSEPYIAPEQFLGKRESLFFVLLHLPPSVHFSSVHG